MRRGHLLLAIPALLAITGTWFAAGPDGDGVMKTITLTASTSKPDGAGKQRITVTVAIEPGWYIYANPTGNKDSEDAATVVKVTGKAKLAAVQVDYPAGQEKPEKGGKKTLVYKDRVEIPVMVVRAKGDTGPLEIALTFQACSDKACLLPSTLRLTLP